MSIPFVGVGLVIVLRLPVRQLRSAGYRPGSRYRRRSAGRAYGRRSTPIQVRRTTARGGACVERWVRESASSASPVTLIRGSPPGIWSLALVWLPRPVVDDPGGVAARCPGRTLTANRDTAG